MCVYVVCFCVSVALQNKRDFCFVCLLVTATFDYTFFSRVNYLRVILSLFFLVSNMHARVFAIYLIHICIMLSLCQLNLVLTSPACFFAFYLQCLFYFCYHYCVACCFHLLFSPMVLTCFFVYMRHIVPFHICFFFQFMCCFSFVFTFFVYK